MECQVLATPGRAIKARHDIGRSSSRCVARRIRKSGPQSGNGPLSLVAGGRPDGERRCTDLLRATPDVQSGCGRRGADAPVAVRSQAHPLDGVAIEFELPVRGTKKAAVDVAAIAAESVAVAV